jgi:Arylsulfotransferase (ASST)
MGAKRPGTRSLPRSGAMVKLLFMLSLCVLMFLYGAFTIQVGIFPHQILREAKVALAAWGEVLWPEPLYEFVDANGAAAPEVVQVPQGWNHDDYILMSGVPYALQSECPTYGCMAWIIDRSGKVHHTWEVDFAALWADAPNPGIKDHGRIAPAGLHLTDQGHLLVSFQSDALFPYGIGMAKFDEDGKVIWKHANYSHHKFSVAPDGLIYTPAHKLLDSPVPLGATRLSIDCDDGKLYSDVILVLNADGQTIEEIDLLDLLVKQNYVGLLGRRSCDPIHLNYVEYVTEEMATASGLATGDLVVSSRHLNMIAAIDGRTRTLKWVVAGRTVAQHSPRVMPDGSILAFDNLGGRRESGGSRIVRLTYGRSDVEEIYPGPHAPEGIDFWTEQQGYLEPHPDGRRLLVSLSEQGRVIELDLPSRRVVWELHNSHDPGPYAAEFGASEGEILRLTTVGAYYVARPSFLDN